MSLFSAMDEGGVSSYNETTDNWSNALQQQQGELKAVLSVSLLQRLAREKAQAEREVARLDELIQLLQENPATERILRLLGR